MRNPEVKIWSKMEDIVKQEEYVRMGRRRKRRGKEKEIFKKRMEGKNGNKAFVNGEGEELKGGVRNGKKRIKKYYVQI